MRRCDFCGLRCDEAIRIGTRWHPACCADADRTHHTDRVRGRRQLRRFGLAR
jgi:hypothetical protein